MLSENPKTIFVEIEGELKPCFLHKNKKYVENIVDFEKLNQDYFWYRFYYSTKTGLLYWKSHTSTRYLGQQAGTNRGDYFRSSVHKNYIYNHRIVFFMHYGVWPELVDHRDLNGLNNKLFNLRDADKTKNAWNTEIRPDNQSGCTGVYKTRNNTWRVYVGENMKSKCLGTYKTFEEAAEVRNNYAINTRGDFYRAIA